MMVGIALTIAIIFGKGLISEAAKDTTDYAKLFHLEKGTIIAKMNKFDVNKDQVKDTVILYGKRIDGAASIFLDHMNVAILDGKSKKIQKSALVEFSGYEPSWDWKDFTGDGKFEVLLSSATGGSGGYVNTALWNFYGTGSGMDLLKDGAALELRGAYVDGYKIEMNIPLLKKQFTVDVSANKDFYQESKIYDQNGKYIDTPVDVQGNGFVGLKAVDRDGNGVFELEGIQRLFGHFNIERISYVTTESHWEEGRWVFDGIEYNTFVQ